MRTLLTCVASLVLAQAASACGGGRVPSLAARLAQADMVAAGRILSVESRPLSLRLARGQEPLPFAVAILKIETMLRGDDRLTHVRVALHQHQGIPVSFEGIFFLTAHAEEPVYTISSEWYNSPINRASNPSYDKQVQELGRLGKLLADPLTSLKSPLSDARFLTAALLVSQFKTFRADIHEANAKTVPIDAAMSRLILKALAETDWNRAGDDYRLSPWGVFVQLEAKPVDGWDVANMPSAVHRTEAARSWLKANEDHFRIQTFARR